MALIIIRRFVGGLLFAAGMFILCDKIGWVGTVGVVIVITGLAVVAGSREFFWSVSQELKAKQEKDTVIS